MEPIDIRFGGGTLDSTLHPIVAVLLVIAAILIWFLPRRYALASLVIGVFVIPIGQVLVVSGVHFPMMRLLIVVGLARCIIAGRKEPGGLFAGGVNAIDLIFALFAVAHMVAFSLQWLSLQAFVKSVGTLLDTLGGYCVLRFLIRDKEDIKSAVKVLAILAAVLGACMVIEQIYRDNIFASLGGGRGILVERGGRVRSQATFETYLTAGSFGATMIPLLAWLWTDSKSRVFTYLGFAGATIMALTTVSSTPVLVYMAGVFALVLWRYRGLLRIFRWAVVMCLLGLQIVMKAPVWALIARVDLTGSSSGYHRYMLVDNFLRHFLDWWLVGYKDYNSWGWDMWDLSNQYVAFGLTGGLITLAFFIVCLSLCYSRLGRARIAAEREGSDAWFYWCLGATLFAHMTNFFGVSYFDQIQFDLYILFAFISVSVVQGARQPVPQPAPSWESWATNGASVLDLQPGEIEREEEVEEDGALQWVNPLFLGKSPKS
jgi:hypothetical protein